MITIAPDAGRTGRPQPDVTMSLSLSADPHAPGTACKLAGAHAGFLGIELCETATLLVSELVTNAVRHGGSEITLHLATSPGRLRVEVPDSGGSLGAPSGEPADTTQAGGRGLVIVEALATSWGVVVARGRPGKCVWFELRDFASPDRTRRRA